MNITKNKMYLKTRESTISCDLTTEILILLGKGQSVISRSERIKSTGNVALPIINSPFHSLQASGLLKINSEGTWHYWRNNVHEQHGVKPVTGSKAGSRYLCTNNIPERILVFWPLSFLADCQIRKRKKREKIGQIVFTDLWDSRKHNRIFSSMYIVLMPFPLQKARSSLKQKKMLQSIWQATWLNCVMPQKYQIKNYTQKTSEK